LWSSTVGVGNDEDPVAAVNRANVGCSIHAESHTVPKRGQVIDHSPEESSRFRAKESWDVLSQEPSGFRFPHNTDDLSPEITLVTRRLAASSKGVGLAWESAADEVNASEFSSVKCSNIVVNWDMGPVFG
jgi:hypothetical protein